MDDTIEWEFEEPASQVDLERLANEVSGIPAVFAVSYMAQLRERAPIVYDRLKQWGKENNRLNWYNFP